MLNRDMHGISRQLFPAQVSARVDHEDGVIVHISHIHAAGESEDAEYRTEGVVAILQDGEPKLELVDKGFRLLDWIDAYCDHPRPKRLDLLGSVLQLHELLLTGSSTRTFVEVQDDLRAPELLQRKRLPVGGRLGDRWYFRPGG